MDFDFLPTTGFSMKPTESFVLLAGEHFQGYLPFSFFPAMLLSRKTPETQGKRIRFLERRMLEKNGESTVRILLVRREQRNDPYKPFLVVSFKGTLVHSRIPY